MCVNCICVSCMSVCVCVCMRVCVCVCVWVRACVHASLYRLYMSHNKFADLDCQYDMNKLPNKNLLIYIDCILTNPINRIIKVNISNYKNITLVTD